MRPACLVWGGKAGERWKPPVQGTKGGTKPHDRVPCATLACHVTTKKSPAAAGSSSGKTFAEMSSCKLPGQLALSLLAHLVCCFFSHTSGPKWSIYSCAPRLMNAPKFSTANAARSSWYHHHLQAPALFSRSKRGLGAELRAGDVAFDFSKYKIVFSWAPQRTNIQRESQKGLSAGRVHVCNSHTR